MPKENIKKPRPYGKMDNNIIVQGVLERKPYWQIAEEAGSKAKTIEAKKVAICEKLTKPNVQALLQAAFAKNRELHDRVGKQLTEEKIQAMDGKEFIDALVKLDNASVNIHKAMRLEAGETTENFNNPQQVLMINNLYANLD